MQFTHDEPSGRSVSIFYSPFFIFTIFIYLFIRFFLAAAVWSARASGLFSISIVRWSLEPYALFYMTHTHTHLQQSNTIGKTNKSHVYPSLLISLIPGDHWGISGERNNVRVNHRRLSGYTHTWWEDSISCFRIESPLRAAHWDLRAGPGEQHRLSEIKTYLISQDCYWSSMINVVTVMMWMLC